MTTAKAKTIDRNLIYNLASVQCSVKEIAETVGVSEAFVRKRFMKIIEKGRAEGRKNIRKRQFEKAMNGDTKMLIWLSKQFLAQKDNPEDREATAPLPWSDDDLPGENS
jgi:predicted ArsR family transcriptional regulator